MSAFCQDRTDDAGAGGRAARRRTAPRTKPRAVKSSVKAPSRSPDSTATTDSTLPTEAYGALCVTPQTSTPETRCSGPGAVRRECPSRPGSNDWQSRFTGERTARAEVTARAFDRMTPSPVRHQMVGITVLHCGRFGGIHAGSAEHRHSRHTPGSGRDDDHRSDPGACSCRFSVQDGAPVRRNARVRRRPRIGVHSPACLRWLLWEGWIWVFGYEPLRDTAGDPWTWRGTVATGCR